MSSLAEPGRRDSPTDLPRAIRVADALTIGIVILAVVVSFEPVHVPLIGVSIDQSVYLLLGAGLIALVRHRFVPAPALASRVADWWRDAQVSSPALTTAVPLAIVVRLAVLVVGYLAVVTIGLDAKAPPPIGPNVWWELPQRWDANWYIGIAREGYEWTGNVANQQNLNFFPAYPMLIRVVGFLVHIHGVPRQVIVAWTATAISIGAFAAASVYIYRITADRFGNDTAYGAVLLVASYPFAVFFSAAYTEALYLLCAAGAWYHLERDQPVPLACWGLLAGLCRPNGALLSVALVALVLTERRTRLSLYAISLMPIVGTLLYSAWAFSFTGHPLVWAELQRSAWLRTYAGLDRTIWEPISRIFETGLISYIQRSPWTMINFAPTLLALAVLWPIARRLGLAAAVFVAVNTLAPLLNGGLVGMGRYTSVLFPIFIWLALVAKKSALPLLATCFGLGQGITAALFFTWRPIF